VVQEKVRSTWKYPTGVLGSQAVTIRFVLDIDGKLVNAEVTNSTDERLSKSAIEAINRASPFLSIPESLKRLAGEPMVIKFAIGSKPKGSPSLGTEKSVILLLSANMELQTDRKKRRRLGVNREIWQTNGPQM
jgi:TonB C terminal